MFGIIEILDGSDVDCSDVFSFTSAMSQEASPIVHIRITITLVDGVNRMSVMFGLVYWSTRRVVHRTYLKIR